MNGLFEAIFRWDFGKEWGLNQPGARSSGHPLRTGWGAQRVAGHFW
jgi:hypothetical protein